MKDAIYEAPHYESFSIPCLSFVGPKHRPKKNLVTMQRQQESSLGLRDGMLSGVYEYLFEFRYVG
jgi:hypothetical protein